MPPISYHTACARLHALETQPAEDRFPTYVPVSFTDTPSLWLSWGRQDQELKKQNLSLKQLIALQEVRAREAAVLGDASNKRREMRHIAVLGKTEDLCKGSLDHILERTRALTTSSDTFEPKE